MLSKQATSTERFKKLQKLSSPYNAGAIQNVKGLKNVSSGESDKKLNNMPKRRNMKRSATQPTIPWESQLKEETSEKEEIPEKEEGEEEIQDVATRLLKMSGVPGESCTCVCLDAQGKHGDQLCGWEPCAFDGVKKPNHCPLLCGEKPAEPEVKVAPRRSELRLTSAQLGYIPTVNKVRRYRFQHCVDEDSSAYIRDYRENKYSSKNSGPMDSSIYAKQVPLGLDPKPKKSQDKAPSCFPCSAKTLSATPSAHGSRLTNNSMCSLASGNFNQPTCGIMNTDKKFECPHEKYIAKYRKLALEEKKAKEARCQPSFSYKPVKIPKPTAHHREPGIELPYIYKVPKLNTRKKAGIEMEAMPNLFGPPSYGFTDRTFSTSNLVNASSFSSLTNINRKDNKNFNSVLSAKLSHLNSSRPSTSKIDAMDNSLFKNQNPVRSNFRHGSNRPTF